ncbi:type I polyketide synthase [Nocardia macrotermitis]|uniref:Uncharacterized protein n=1 Tax=Nocardia macrotermitis TaxID=2585198 RepID=A0A7K0DEC0_9NOCA|nr:type I polyketide synthase [Nocardia macrotermitis]MQY23989.1 hypothetical protein [Nocardia macrotermitis]
MTADSGGTPPPAPVPGQRDSTTTVESAAVPPVAIIGIGARVPGAHGVDEFWRLLREGRDGTGAPPRDRAGARHGGYLDGLDAFDNDWFAISEREAAVLDPQQRLALEVAVEALDDAGVGYRVRGSHTAVLFGACGYDHGSVVLGSGGRDAPYAVTGSALSIIANRLSYALDLHGPSLVLDSACSSSLAAVDLALRLLADRTVDLAIVGGVNLTLLQHTSDYMDQAGFLAPDGRCKPFDAAADGYARSDGCTVLILQRTADARREGNRIYAEIIGAAVGSDGRSNGLYAPNGLAQQQVIRRAWARAGTAPTAAGYIECHGTGTPLGDAVEVGALAAVLAEGDRTHRVWIGSVKSNIGHLEAAAGVTGVAKAALHIAHATIAPNLHFHTENPLLDLASRGLAVPTEPIGWAAESASSRYAGVSSFGFGGTNAHVVLRGVDTVAPQRNTDPPILLTITGRDEADIRQQATRWAEALNRNPASLPEFAAATTRSLPEQIRAAIVARNRTDAIAQLLELAETPPPANPTPTPPADTLRPEGTDFGPIPAKPVRAAHPPGQHTNSTSGATPAQNTRAARAASPEDSSTTMLDTTRGRTSATETPVDSATTPVPTGTNRTVAISVESAAAAADSAITSGSAPTPTRAGDGDATSRNEAAATTDTAITPAYSVGPTGIAGTGNETTAATAKFAITPTTAAGPNGTDTTADSAADSAVTSTDATVSTGVDGNDAPNNRDTATTTDSAITSAGVAVPTSANGIDETSEQGVAAPADPAVTSGSASTPTRAGDGDATSRNETAADSAITPAHSAGSTGIAGTGNETTAATADFVITSTNAAGPNGADAMADGAAAASSTIASASAAGPNRTTDTGKRTGATDADSTITSGSVAGPTSTNGTGVTSGEGATVGSAIVSANAAGPSGAADTGEGGGKRSQSAAFSRNTLGHNVSGDLAGAVLPRSARVHGPVGGRRRGRVLLVFSGQGGQHERMGRGLAARYPVFARALAEATDAVSAAGGPRVWTPRHGFGHSLETTDMVQPALFVFQIALAELLAHWGIRADAVIGHSLGEIAAAVVSGALSLGDGARIAVARSAILAHLDGRGAMAMLEATPEEAGRLVEPVRAHVAVAAVNGPRSVVVSGTPRYVDTLIRRATRRSFYARRIAVDFAAHSPQVREPAAELLARLDGITPRTPRIPLYSTARRGARITSAALDARYWSENAEHTVELATALESAAADGCTTAIEISPHPILAPAIREFPEFREATHPMADRDDESAAFLDGMAHWYLEGRPADWSALGTFTGPILERRWRHAIFPLLTATGPTPAPEDLRDHVVRGVPVVPAMYWLRRMLRTAGERTTRLTDFTVREATDLAALPDTTCHARADQLTVTGPIPLATARIAAEPTPAELVAWMRTIDAHRIAQPGMRPVDPREFYAMLRARGLEYGPRFRTLRGIVAESSSAIGLLGHIPLDTAALDGCLQLIAAAAGPHLPADVLPLPTHLDSAWLTPSSDVLLAQAHAFLRSTTPTGLRCDILATDQHGAPAAALLGIHIHYTPLPTTPNTSHSPSPTTHPNATPRPTNHPPTNRPAAEDSLVPDTEAGWNNPNASPYSVGTQHTISRNPTRPDQPHTNGPTDADRRTDNSGSVEGTYSDGAEHYLHTAEQSNTTATHPGATPHTIGEEPDQPHADDPLGAGSQAARPGGRETTLSIGANNYRWHTAEHFYGPAIHPDAAQHTIGGNPTRPDRRTLAPEEAEGTYSGGAAGYQWHGAEYFHAPTTDPDTTQHTIGSNPAPPDRPDLRTVGYDGAEGPYSGGAEYYQWPAAGNLDGRAVNPDTTQHTIGGDSTRPDSRAVGSDGGEGTYSGGADGYQWPAAGNFDGRAVHTDAAQRPVGYDRGRADAQGGGGAGWEFGEYTHSGVRQWDRAGVDEGGHRVVGRGEWDRGVLGAHGLGAVLRREAWVRVGAPEVGREARVRRVLVIGESRLAVGLARDVDRWVPAERVARDPGEAGPIVSATLTGRTDPTAVVAVWPAAPTPGSVVAEIGRGLGLLQRIQECDAMVSLTVVLRDRASVIQQGIAGLVRSLQLESGRPVRLVWAGPERAEPGPLTGLTLTMDGPDEVRIGPGGVQARQFEPVSFLARPVEIQPAGAYVVTGGLGALGAVAARWLLDSGAGDVVVLTRHPRPLPPLLEGLEDRIVVLRCDVTDPRELANALHDIRECGAPIRGLIHAAGTLHDAEFSSVTTDLIAEMFEPKLAATADLLDLTAADPLDFVLLFSSATGALGAPGQAAYAAANAALDALAATRANRKVISIGWGSWESGLAATAGGAEHLRRAGITPFTTTRGTAVLDALRGYPGPHVLAMDYTPTTDDSPIAHRLRTVLPTQSDSAPIHPTPSNHRTDFTHPRYPNPARYPDHAIGPADLSQSDQFYSATGFPAPAHPANDSAYLYGPSSRSGQDPAADSPTDTSISEDKAERHSISEFTDASANTSVVQVIRSTLAATLGIAPESIAAEVDFTGLGLSSLLAIELRRTLEARLGIRIATAELFEHPTVAMLAAALSARLSDDRGGNR